ncbi:M20/M25/M40 family metallo-hydrolase [Kineosporiaceae bacterium SCSIO 59966]|nr:M20/M25/M40 family metallo-hydrolase [Kineosporiaceae bacterium SCSIO 59966]
MRTRRRTWAALAAAGGLVLAGLAPAGAAAAGNPNNPRKLAQSVEVDAVWEHLEALQEIADANGGNRAAGTSGYEASAEYVEQVLQDAGYETERQYFPFTYEEVLASSLVVGGVMYESRIMSYSPNTDGPLTAGLSTPATATGCSAEEWGGVDATGTIALVSRGVCPFAAKSLAAAAAGAEAVIVYNNAPEPLNGTLGTPDDGYVPTTGISGVDGQTLLAALEEDPGLQATLEIEVLVEERQTFNVLAETEAGRDDNVVMLGAHLDGAMEGPGINDNGTGSAAILEVAVQLAEAKKLNNTVRFAWWGAEEVGLVGSWHYVEDLAANDPAGLDEIATYLNFDMVGSPNYVIGVYDADQSTYEAPVDVPEGSAATEQVFTDYFDSIGQPWVDTEFSGRSDYQPFIVHGIPASGLFTGADGVKTDEEVATFGGTAGLAYDPNYHTAEDDLDNVDRTALETMSKAIAAATMSLATDTSEINGKRSAGKSGKPHPAKDAADAHEVVPAVA